MNLLTTSWDFRSLWVFLPLQTRLYLLCLFGAAIYSGISLTKVFIRIRKLPGLTLGGDAEVFRRRISVRLQNLRQLHFLFLLLFGLFLADQTFGTARSLTYLDTGFAAPTIAELLDPLLGFAVLSLLILTVLHSLQWLVSSRLEAKTRQTTKTV
jgi:hypothetical protein